MASNKIDIDKIISSMTLKEKIGQLCIPILQESTIPEDIEKAITEKCVGFIRYCPNVSYDMLSDPTGEPNKALTPEQTAELMNELQKLAQKTKSKIPLVISVDQEGGIETDVNRGGVTVFPSLMGFGAVNDPDLTKRACTITGRELRSMGIILSQCPALDVINVNTRAAVKLLSFGDTTELVTKQAVAMITGFKAGGLGVIVKHFPSYGVSAVDPHKGLPTIDKSKEQLEKDDTVVYKHAIKAGVDGIMAGHVIAECLDSSKKPATLSEKILNGYLRKDLGFDRVIQTDAMKMEAIMSQYGIEKAVVMTVQAGCDTVLLRGDISFFEEGYNAIANAVKTGKISESRLNESIKRILTAKVNLGLFNNPFVDQEKVKEVVGKSEHKKVSLEVARKSITLVRDRKNMLPLKPDSSTKILIVNVKAKKLETTNDLIQSVDMLIRAIRKHHPNTKEYFTQITPTEKEISEAVRMARDSDLLIVSTCNASIYPEQVQLVKNLRSTGKPMLNIALQSPYDLVEFPDVDTYLCTYAVSNDSMIALAEVVFGKLKASGKLPVTMVSASP